MAQNLKLDPSTRDYVIENGSPVASDRIEEAAYFSLVIPRDKWLHGLPDQGSLLHTLQGEMHTPAIEQQFANYAEDAINRQMIARGKAAAVAAGNLEQSATVSQNQVQIVPAENQFANQLNFSPV